MRQQGVDEALSIRTERQAEEGAVGTQLVAASLRSSGVGVTESDFTAGTRADRLSASGSLENDLWYETDTAWLYRWGGVSWQFVTGLYAATDATRLALSVSAADNGALFYATDAGKLWKVEAGAWADKFVTLTVTTSFKVGANQVVGARGAAVANVASADATDLASAITLANETKAQLNALLARARSHGLIAT